MNQQQTVETPALSEISHGFGAWATRVLWPAAGTGKLRAARRVAGALTVVGSLIQIVIWLLVAVFSRHSDSPWWLFYTAGGATVIASLLIVEESGATGSTSEGIDL